MSSSSVTTLLGLDSLIGGSSFLRTCAAGKKVSIDTPIGGEEDELTLGDTLADDAPSFLRTCVVLLSSVPTGGKPLF